MQTGCRSVHGAEGVKFVGVFIEAIGKFREKE